MAQLSIAAAARAAGKDRGTIHRYIKSGKLSATKNASGHTVIETAELLRVFGALEDNGEKTKKAAAKNNIVQHVENSSTQHFLEATLELLKQQLKASQEREERLLTMLGHEQESRRELERRLLPPGTGQDDFVAETLDQDKGHTIIIPEETSIPLSSQQSEANQDLPQKEKKGFFASLFKK